MTRNVDAVDLNALQSPLEHSADERSRIETIIKSQISKAQANIKKDPKGKEDPTLTKWEVNYNDFGVNLGELTKHWEKLHTAVAHLRTTVYGMNDIETKFAFMMSKDFEKRPNSIDQSTEVVRASTR